MARAKSTIPYERLKEIMKLTITEPGEEWPHCDQDFLVKKFKAFFMQVACETHRINGVAAGACAKDLFQLPKEQACLFGTALSKALAACKKAGDRSTNGAKLTEDVKAVYYTMLERSPASSSSVKKEADEKRLATPIKNEPGVGSTSTRSLKLSISSPTQIANLYSTSSVRVKAEPESRLENKSHCLFGASCGGGSAHSSANTHTYIYIYIFVYIVIYMYIYIYIYI